MGERRRSLLAYGAALLTCATLLVVLLELWRADLRVPFVYFGDALCVQLWVKGLAEHGWFLDNPSLGAPFGLEMHDFPLADGLFFLLLRGSVLIFRDQVAALHAYGFATFFLATASAMFAMRRLGAAQGPAAVCGLLYSFLFYHFFRGESHLFLASYFLVPLAVMLCLGIDRDGGWFFREDTAGGARLDVANRRAIGSIVLCLLLGSGGVYYAAFSCFLLIVAGLRAAVWRRRWHPLGSAAILAGLIVAGGLVNLAPTILYRLRHGPNPEAVVRYPIHAELWGLRITQLLLPVPDHRIGALARLRRRYDFAQTVPPFDSDASSLGVIGAAGFLGLLAAAVLRRRVKTSGPIDELASLNLAAVLLATASGFGALAGYVVSPLLRCYNRISVFIAFFALTAVALVLTRVVGSARPGWPRLAARFGLAAILVLGILDQTPHDLVPDYEALRADYARDAAFIGRIERALPPGAMVFQLPILDFPESVPPGAMFPYDHGRAYVHSKSLRWSFGTMKGRYADSWQKAAADQPTPAMLRSLALAGFSGIYVDRAGFDDRGAALESRLRLAAGAATIVSDNHRLAFYDLRPFATALRDRLGPAAWAEASAACLDAVTANWVSGVLARVDVPDGTSTRICSNRGRLRLDNPSDRSRRVELSMDLGGLAAASHQVRIDWPDGPASYRSDGPVRRSLIVPPGGLTVSLTSASPIAHDPKAPAFRVERFTLAETIDSPRRLAGGAASTRR